MNITYRLTVASDVIDLLNLAEEYCKENNLPYDLPSVKNYIDLQLGNLPSAVAVDMDTSEVVGVISFALTPYPYKSDILMGRKVTIFVKKEYRSNGIGNELLRSAEEAAKLKGATIFHFSSPIKPNDSYTAFETEFTKEL